ncbi:hypothetical protein F5Y19DRAFT_404382 [Xylariaceae sp. FL1651]|nr:hypothetical protein F5Y19DRAFT_404382 [Xylariaceae sp. FL1651]
MQVADVKRSRFFIVLVESVLCMTYSPAGPAALGRSILTKTLAVDTAARARLRREIPCERTDRFECPSSRLSTSTAQSIVFGSVVSCVIKYIAVTLVSEEHSVGRGKTIELQPCRPAHHVTIKNSFSSLPSTSKNIFRPSAGEQSIVAFQICNPQVAWGARVTFRDFRISP